MLSTSLRRAAWTPIVPISGIARATAAGVAGSSASSGNAQSQHQQHVRQRRYSSSSSKPSDGSSRGIDTSSSSSSSSAPAKGVNGSGENKREGKSRRRGKQQQQQHQQQLQQQQDAVFSKLPSVPSTQYQQPHDVHVASFFSIHRPISVSTTVPPASSLEAFDTIFTPRKSSKGDQEDVMFTLSSAVQSMENSAQNFEQDDLSRHQLEVEMQQPYDSMNMNDMKMSVEELTKRLRPFHPPPPPTPLHEAKKAAAAAKKTEESAKASSASSQDGPSYSTVLTIHESTDATGRKTYEAHTTPFVRTKDMDMDAPGATTEHEAYIDFPSRAPTTYMERVRNNRTMYAISTKRRRRAKIKKHKFKKLLRKTRTLRRKLDKA